MLRPLDALVGLLLAAALMLGLLLAVAVARGEFAVREDLRWTEGRVTERR